MGSTDAGVDGDDEDVVLARSFVVRALLEPLDGGRGVGWHGIVTDAETGRRARWERPEDIGRIVGRALHAGGGEAAVGLAIRLGGVRVAGPALTDVVADMLGALGTRLPAPVVALPAHNVTLESVRERTAGLGSFRGDEPAGPLGTRTLRGARLDAQVRFQVWGTGPSDVDAALLAVQTAVLDDADELRAEGFLRLVASGATLAEEETSVPAWRKTGTFDVLYEYTFVDDDDAASLIARIPVGASVDTAPATTESETVTGAMVRWDEEGAPALAVHGPGTFVRLSALAFDAGAALGGTVTLTRTSGSGAPVLHLPDLDTFLAQTTGTAPALTDADVTGDPATFLAALGAPAPGVTLGDWNTDGVLDAYAAHDRRFDEPLVLRTAADRLTLTYTSGAGPGLDHSAVVYLRFEQS
jgi:hypothetical protein